MFALRNGDSYAALFHRWRGLTFEYRDRRRAAEIAGNELYDHFPLGTEEGLAIYPPVPPDTPQSLAEAAKRQFDRASAGDADLLLLIQPAEMNKI